MSKAELEKRFDELFDKQYEKKQKLTFEERMEYFHISYELAKEEQKRLFYEAIENCDYIMG